MNRPLRRLCVVAFAGLVLSLSSRAAAQPVTDLPRVEVITPAVSDTPPPLPVVPAMNDRTLVVDVRTSRGTELALARGLDDHLRRAGHTMVPRSLDGGPNCETIACLEDTAKRENAGILLFTQVDEKTPGNFAITVSLYDAIRHAPLQDRGECLQCNQALLSFKINEVADGLISRTREARQSAAANNATGNAPGGQTGPDRSTVNSFPLTSTRNAPPSEGNFFTRLPRSRKILASVLGGLAGAALITSIILTTTNGLDTPISCDMRTDVLQDKCILKNKPLYATGYALTGALAVGIGFTLFWPQKKPVQAAAPGVR